MKAVELLAPAKDLAGGLDAVRCGADAVYIGAPEFGCRKGAENPVSEIEKLAAYAHRYRVKVYAAVNTILDDEELKRAARMIRRLWNAGIDAVIVADMGLLETPLPPVPLIASVQARVDTPEKAAFFEKAGFSRLTLARDLSLAQIKEIRARTSAELECFVHGSLGVANDGQCYWNWSLGGAVGNRCHSDKPCRKTYTLRDGDGRALARDQAVLSLKDLDLSAHLGELLDAGVRALKIEGRQKSRDYARNVIAAYRRALDAVLEGRGLRKSSEGRCVLPFTPDLSKAPSRGRTTYFLHGRDAEMAAPGVPEPPPAAADAAFLEALRRPLPDRVLDVPLPAYRRARARRKRGRARYPSSTLDYTANVRNAAARRFYRRHGVEEIEGSVETGAPLAGRPLMEMRYCLRHQLGLCAKAGRTAEERAARPGPLFMEDGAGRRYRLEFDCKACRMTLTADGGPS